MYDKQYRMVKWFFALLVSTTAGLGFYAALTQPTADDIISVYYSIVIGCQLIQLYVLLKYHHLLGIYQVAIIFQVIAAVFAWKVYNFLSTSVNAVVVSLCCITDATYVGAVIEQALCQDLNTRSLYQPFVAQNENTTYVGAVVEQALSTDFTSRTLYQPFIAQNEDTSLTVQCTICLDDVVEPGQQEGVRLQCGHVFHQRCIDGWLGSSMNRGLSCPNCRASLTSVQVDE